MLRHRHWSRLWMLVVCVRAVLPVLVTTGVCSGSCDRKQLWMLCPAPQGGVLGCQYWWSVFVLSCQGW